MENRHNDGPIGRFLIWMMGEGNYMAMLVSLLWFLPLLAGVLFWGSVIAIIVLLLV